VDFTYKGIVKGVGRQWTFNTATKHCTANQFKIKSKQLIKICVIGGGDTGSDLCIKPSWCQITLKFECQKKPKESTPWPFWPLQ
jgi:NADPH-dependent glutamate synthase beta subunit-like oxidoreductase